MIVRSAQINDCEAISTLNYEVQDIHALEYPEIFKPPSAETFSSVEVKEILQKENALMFVAESDGKIIGYIYGEITNFPENSIRYSVDALYIHHIAVTRSHRKRGAGKQLIERMTAYAEEIGPSIVMLDIWSFNEGALDFFKKQGFSVFNYRMWLHM